ncbi:MAG: FAD-binding oxidoreductase [Candidatus Eremiobacteraeota bacterium]|nr:FAD-binding oxidoreductase [Candidatus Eremiobacteraeota bacterium]
MAAAPVVFEGTSPLETLTEPALRPELKAALEAAFPAQALKFDEIYRGVYGRDGSYFEYHPQAVVRVASVADVQRLLRIGAALGVPITLRAGGSSLSGQTVGTGIVADQRFFFRRSELRDDGRKVWFEPGLTVLQLNHFLKPAGKKVGPDPASSQVAMMGGVLANNSSGMQAGTKYSAYTTLASIDFVLPNGNRYDTASADDRARFARHERAIHAGLAALRDEVRGDADLNARIRRKYEIKNVSGYAINAFLDHDEPLEILARLLIGSEGTLAYIASAELFTLPVSAEQSSTLLFFHNVVDAAAAVPAVVATKAAAVEMMDIASLRSTLGRPGVPEIVASLPDGAAALLVDYHAADADELAATQARATETIRALPLLAQLPFSTSLAERALLWTVRDGIFASVGGARKPGTTIILEDVAVPVDSLDKLILGLQQLFATYGYDGAIFGHASVGNIHFLVTDDMSDGARVAHFGRFMNDVVALVLAYDGSLKAEHGTGRAMAPFIETEWGAHAYGIMKRLKTLIDPANMMNPGVIINDDPNVHLAHIKGMPLLGDPVADRCIECGFCEWVCPTRYSTLTPRQRIQAHRVRLSLERAGERGRARTIARQYAYEGRDSCIADGMCQTVCPVGISTAYITDNDRAEAAPKLVRALMAAAAKHFIVLENAARTALTVGTIVQAIFGRGAMPRVTAALAKLLPGFPQWSPHMGRAPGRPFSKPANADIVYFPSCVTRMMGSPARGKDDAMRTLLRVAKRAGIEVYLPKDSRGLCCSQIFAHQGFARAQRIMANRTVEAMYAWSDGGRLPVLCDVTSCARTLLLEMETGMWGSRPRVLSDENQKKYKLLRFIDVAEWLHDDALPRLGVTKPKRSIVLHPTCACRELGLDAKIAAIGRTCASESYVPFNAGCCGAGGDRGFRYPEGTESALRDERTEVAGRSFDGAYSFAKSCEIVLSDRISLDFESIVHLVDETTSP